MILTRISRALIRRSERQFGVKFEYIHEIAQTDLGLLLRYNKVFSFLDPNKKAPRPAYHTARLRGAIAADCGTCVEAEINLATRKGMDAEMIDQVLTRDYAKLSKELAAVATLADAVVERREDDPTARAIVRSAYGDAGLIEVCYAMNGAALLPGVKRALGHATSCDLGILRKQAKTRKQ